MRKLLLRIFLWFFWKNFCYGLKSFLGHKTLAASIKEMNAIADRIRSENGLTLDDPITWANSGKTNREVFAKYITLKHFNDVGEMLAFFNAVDKKRILEAEPNVQ